MIYNLYKTQEVSTVETSNQSTVIFTKLFFFKYYLKNDYYNKNINIYQHQTNELEQVKINNQKLNHK